MKKIKLLFIFGFIFGFYGKLAHAESEPEIAIHDILSDQSANFGPFQSISAKAMGEWLFVYRFVESEEPKDSRRYLAVGLRFDKGSWSGTVFCRTVTNGTVFHDNQVNLSGIAATRFIAAIDSSEIFNLTSGNQTRIPTPGGTTLMGEELSTAGCRSFIRATNTSVPSQQIVHCMDTFSAKE